MRFRVRDIVLPNIQTAGIKAAPTMIARTSPVELEPADVLDEVILGGQHQDAAAVAFAEGELRQPEQVIPSFVITDVPFVVVAGCVTVAARRPQFRN